MLLAPAANKPADKQPISAGNTMRAIHQSDIKSAHIKILEKPMSELHPAAAAPSPAPKN